MLFHALAARCEKERLPLLVRWIGGVSARERDEEQRCLVDWWKVRRLLMYAGPSLCSAL